MREWGSDQLFSSAAGVAGAGLGIVSRRANGNQDLENRNARRAGRLACGGAACGYTRVDPRGGLVTLPVAVQRPAVQGAVRSPPAFRSQPRAAEQAAQYQERRLP